MAANSIAAFRLLAISASTSAVCSSTEMPRYPSCPVIGGTDDEAVVVVSADMEDAAVVVLDMPDLRAGNVTAEKSYRATDKGW